MTGAALLHEAVVLIGPTDVATSPWARRLERGLGYRRIDLDHLLAWRADVDDPVGRRIAIARARGLLGPKDAVIATFVDHLARLPLDLPIVIEGFPRTPLHVAAIDDGRVPLDVAMAIWVDADPALARPPAVPRGRRGRGGPSPEIPATARIRAAREDLESVRTHYRRRGLLHVVGANGDPGDICRVARRVLESDTVAR